MEKSALLKYLDKNIEHYNFKFDRLQYELDCKKHDEEELESLHYEQGVCDGRMSAYKEILKELNN